jgi:hypothetical protein
MAVMLHECKLHTSIQQHVEASSYMGIDIVCDDEGKPHAVSLLVWVPSSAGISNKLGGTNQINSLATGLNDRVSQRNWRLV